MLIQLENVYKIYGGGENRVHALDGVSLTVEKGEFVAVVGRSGSGKSTLMNLLGCLDVPTRGHYRLDGRDVARMSEDRLANIRREHIGFIFQGFNLIPALSALENVELPLIYRGIPKEKRRQLSAESLCRVGLSDRMHHRPSEMSGGQQQRVAIARAIASRPPIVLADEPTGNLDSKAGAAVMEMLRELNAEGHTVILITHDDSIASSVPRSVRIRDGRVAKDTSCNGCLR